MELYPHQREAVDLLRDGCVLKGGVGTGKTRTACAYYDRTTEPWVPVLVITTAKKRDSRDWEVEFEDIGMWPEFLVVDSWHNLKNYEDVTGMFVIFDEQRLVGTGAWVDTFYKIARNNRWILLSATPGDSWLEYIPLFIAHGFYKNRTDFLRKHVVFEPFNKYPKVRGYLDESILQAHLKKILVEMPYERKTTRNVVDIYVEYDRELFKRVFRGRWNYLEERPIRTVSELFSLAKRVVNSDPSRLDRIKDLLIEHPRMIIFYNFNYELEILRTLDVKKAEWNGQKHEDLPDGEEWVYLVQYASGAEGWNCTATDTMLFYSMTYSYKVFEQAQGRIDRLNTEFEDLWYYVLRSASPIDIGIARALDEKKTFNEAEFLRTAA